MAPPKPMERKFLYRILLTALGSSLLLFGAITTRLYFLQCVHHDYWTEKAKSLHAKTVKITPQRGSIYSSEGHPLATSTFRESAYLAPRYLHADPDFQDSERQYRRLAYRLANCLKLDPKIVEKKLRGRSDSALHRKLGEETVKELLAIREEMDLPAPAMYFVREGTRLYPKGNLASHIVGFTQPDSYGDNIGVMGVEAAYNRQIAGKYSEDKVQVNIQRQDLSPLEDEVLLRATGNDIHLTINEAIQEYAEQALAEHVAKFESRGGVCVVMEVGTGAVLAMASNPTFDINERGSVAAAARKNRCLVDAIWPGSVMKTFTAAALIERNKMSPNEMIDCHMGKIFYPGRKRPISDHHGMGVVPVHEAFAESSNVAFTLLGLRLTKEEHHEQLRRLGFGYPTGIDMPGEGSGIMRGVDKWSLQSRISISIGYEIMVTPIQVASAMAAIANKGLYVKPHVLKEIRSPKGETLFRYEPRVLRRVCSPQTSEILLGMMEEVVTSGTGDQAAVLGYRIGGKTGTTVKDRVAGEEDFGRKRYYASFLGALPINNPQVVIYTWVDEPNVKWGGSVAAPLFGQVAAHVVRILNLEPTEKIERKGKKARDLVMAPEPTPAAARRVLPALPVPADVGPVMPDFTGLTVREVMAALNRLRMDAQLTGWGVAVQQHPAPGQPAPAGTRPMVVFASPNQAADEGVSGTLSLAASESGSRLEAGEKKGKVQ